MVLLDYYYERKWNSPKILILEKAPWWSLSMIIGAVNLLSLNASGSLLITDETTHHNGIGHLAIGAYSYVVYLAKWIYPYRMSSIHPYPDQLPIAAYIALALAPVCIAAVIYWAVRTRNRNIIFGWAFFTANVMFMLQIVGAGKGFLADRFTYIAYAGLFFLAACGYQWFARKWPALRKHLYIFAGIYIAFLGCLTWNQCKVWKNGGTLWDHAVECYPRSSLAWAMRGYYAREEERDFTKAIELFSHSLELERNKTASYNHLGKTYFDEALFLNPRNPALEKEKSRLLDLSIRSYTSALEEDSRAGRPDPKITSKILINRGATYGTLGMFENARSDLTRGIQLNPKNPDGYLNRALLFARSSQFENAIQDHNEYLRINHFDADIVYERGLCRSLLQQTAQAIRDFDAAIALNPTQPRYFLDRAKARFASGDKTGARSDALRAQQMGLPIPREILY
jgi:tetratricopeptide (TPR) repeat protein